MPLDTLKEGLMSAALATESPSLAGKAGLGPVANGRLSLNSQSFLLCGLLARVEDRGAEGVRGRRGAGHGVDVDVLGCNDGLG